MSLKAKFFFTRCLATVAVLLMIGAGSHATEVVPGNIQGWKDSYSPPSPQELGCDTKAATEDACYRLREKHSDKYLAGIRSRVVARLTTKQGRMFSSAERKWDEFKRAACEFEAASARISSAGSTLPVCGYVYNVSRIRLLSKYEYCLNRGVCSSDFALYLIVSWEGK
jgi:hypothetical protein